MVCNTPESDRFSLVVTSAAGGETVLSDELQLLGVNVIEVAPTAVTIEANKTQIYRINIWSRLAQRILLPVLKIDSVDPDDLYEAVHTFDWSKYLGRHGSISMDVTVKGDTAQNSHFAMLRAKDGLSDWATEHQHNWNFSPKNADARVYVFIDKESIHVGLVASGGSMHQRGWRKGENRVEAPMRETQAAIMAAELMRTAELDKSKQALVVDPFCGSATLLIEMALQYLNLPAGINRPLDSLNLWVGHEPQLLDSLRQQAQTSYEQKVKQSQLKLVGYDASANAVRAAISVVEAAGLTDIIHIEKRSLAQFNPPAGDQGLVITNPPYGERLGEIDHSQYLYNALANKLRTLKGNWFAGVVAAHIDHLDELRLQEYQQWQGYNGPIKIWGRSFALSALKPAQDRAALVPEKRDFEKEEAQAFANRLLKNYKQLKKWIVQDEIQAYRLYDADLPQINLAVDVYADCLHVQEYAAPKSLDEKVVKARLDLAIDTLRGVFRLPATRLFVKTRQKQKGKQQYSRQSSQQKMMPVKEGQASILINLTDYLDTGLFLDHRPARRYLYENAKGKHVLNLFCYTGSASIQAALGGAKTSLSVDMSHTYLNWYRANLAFNGLSPDAHKIDRADVLQWLGSHTDQFDLIFIDPPTFSNSKKMHEVFDVQEQHADLIRRAMRHLAPGGEMVFSNNFRKFVLDSNLENEFSVKSMDKAWLPKDFERRPNIHHCWLIKHKEVAQEPEAE